MNNLTFDQFWSMENKIKMLELENESIKKLNKELKQKFQSELESKNAKTYEKKN